MRTVIRYLTQIKQRAGNQKGFAAFFLTFIIFIAVFLITLSISFLALAQQNMTANLTASAQSYYTAEGGVEDALLRLNKGMSYSSPYTLNLGATSTNVTITSSAGGVYTVTSKGNDSNRYRKIETVYQLSGTSGSFHYGAQVGAGGVTMHNNSTISGNIFSDGSVSASGSADITGTVSVAGMGHSITGATIGGDAYTDTCDTSDVSGVLYANSESGCSYSNYVVQNPPSSIPLPFTSSDITGWENDAAAGGTISGDYTLSSGNASLGPKKIDGNLTVSNTSQLRITGTIWVTGNIIIENSAQIYLDNSYGTGSGTIIANGTISLENNSVSSGSGNAGSYLMYLSTSSANPAIVISQSAKADILYASSGIIQIANSASMREITAYGLDVENSATVTYTVGLASVLFTSGPSTGWQVTSWKETN